VIAGAGGEDRPPTARNGPMRIFGGNLTYTTTEEELERLFEP